MPSIAQAIVKDVRVVMLGAVHPPPAEFAEHVAEAVAWEPRVRCVMVVVAPGGGLDARERSELAKAKLFSKPVAVLVSSQLTRSILTAVSWLGGVMAAFAPQELDAACDHLLIPVVQRAALAEQIEALRTSIGLATRR